MKGIYLPILLILSILAILVQTANSQIQSAAFDPKCYQPVIGTPGVVDTIYGSRNAQELGARVKNLWQMPGESYGRIVISEGSGLELSNPIFASGPTFDLHHLLAVDTFNIANKALPLNDPNYLIRRGHFRSK